ncbi:hypothetical protein ACP70R_014632 [Stipagrostis hirtigluma subsp. patula]
MAKSIHRAAERVVDSSRAAAAYGGGAVAGFLPVSGHRGLSATALLPEGRRARPEAAAGRAKLTEVSAGCLEAELGGVAGGSAASPGVLSPAAGTKYLQKSPV